MGVVAGPGLCATRTEQGSAPRKALTTHRARIRLPRMTKTQPDFDGLVVAAGEPVAATLHGREELLEVDLEGGEDLVGVVLGAEADLALGLASVLDDLLGGALGLAVDLFARRSGARTAREPP